jgi:hypothetical protein
MMWPSSIFWRNSGRARTHPIGRSDCTAPDEIRHFAEDGCFTTSSAVFSRGGTSGILSLRLNAPSSSAWNDTMIEKIALPCWDRGDAAGRIALPSRSVRPGG